MTTEDVLGHGGGVMAADIERTTRTVARTWLVLTADLRASVFGAADRASAQEWLGRLNGSRPGAYVLGYADDEVTTVSGDWQVVPRRPTTTSASQQGHLGSWPCGLR